MKRFVSLSGGQSFIFVFNEKSFCIMKSVFQSNKCCTMESSCLNSTRPMHGSGLNGAGINQEGCNSQHPVPFSESSTVS